MKFCMVIALILLWTTPATALLISEDTLWEGEQVVTEDVRVMPGVTLTVAPGSVIRFTGSRLEVSGVLIARDAEFSGERWDGLLLKGNDATTRLTGCLIKGADTGIQVQGGTPLLDRLVLTGNKVGIELRGKASGSISNSTFVASQKVGLFVKDDSTTAIIECSFEDNGRYGAYLYRARPESFRGNIFTGNDIALMIAFHGSDPVVEDNRFGNNEIAIQVDRAARPVLRGNLLQGNRTGLHAYRRSDPVVTGNRFIDNDIGILVAYSSYPQIEGNDFIDNKMALKLEYQSSDWEEQHGAQARGEETTSRTAFAGQGMRSVSEDDRKARDLDGTVNAVGNWWGEDGVSELARGEANQNPSFIHDGRDQATFVDAGEEFPLDRVTFAPWSETPVAEIQP